MKWYVVTIKYEDKGSEIEVKETLEDTSAYYAINGLRHKHNINPDKITYCWANESIRNITAH